MAFVPKVHNRQVPTANQALYKRDAYEAQRKHRLAIERMKPAIDNAWGRTWNGVKDTKRHTYPHIQVNLKRAQLEDERAQAIEMENFHLLEKLSKILERPQNPNHKTREWGGGVRLDAHQVPTMDHLVPEKTTTFGAAVEAKSLNIGWRERQQQEIVRANHQLVKRIQMCKPTYDRKKQLDDHKWRKWWLWNQAVANRPLDAPTTTARHRGARPAPPPPRSQAARRGRRQRRQRRQPRAPRAATAAAAGRRRPARPATARPAKPKRGQSEVHQRAAADASVLKVLDLLSAQRSKISSLHELRAQKDVLMNAVYTPPEGVETTLLEAAGLVIHVTSSAEAAARPDQLLVLVHGGLFMSGSRRRRTSPRGCAPSSAWRSRRRRSASRLSTPSPPRSTTSRPRTTTSAATASTRTGRRRRRPRSASLPSRRAARSRWR